MADDRKVHQLFADADAPNYYRRSQRGWIAQRAGWAALAAFVVAGAAGLFGSGPLSSGRIVDDRLSVDYERFVRRDAASDLVFRIAEAPGRAELWLGGEWLEGANVESIAPAPVAQRIEADRVVFAFDVAGPATITLRYRPTVVGRLAGRAGLAGGTALSFDQFSYP